MSSLQSLPLELLLSVADYLTSRELFSLCVTCKQYWKELEPVVQKKRQAEEYREIDFSAFDYEARATLQHLLLENPSLLHFVEKVIIEKELHSYEVVCDENGTMLGRRWKRRDLDTSNAFISLIRDDSLLYSLHGIEGDEPEEYRNKLEQAIRDGDDGPLLAYFLELVPNLEELHLPLIPYMWSDSWMFSSVKQIVVAYSGVHRSLPLQRLTRIEFTDHYPTVVKLDWVFCAMRIPSLRSLRVSARSQVQGSDARVDQCVALSNIDDLELDFEAIAPETVSQILASVRSLKRFSLSLAGWCNRSFDSSAILRKLVTQTSHSLESVSFNWNPYWENVGSPISLRDFQKLKSLDCAWRDLIPEHDIQGSELRYEDSLDLAPLLPVSLEFLSLREACPAEKNVVIRLLKSKKSNLVHWKTLIMSTLMNGWTEISNPDVHAEVATAAKEAGVDYTAYSLLPEFA